MNKHFKSQTEILMEAAQNSLNSIREGGPELYERYQALGGVLEQGDLAFQTIRDRAAQYLQEAVVDPRAVTQGEL